MMINGYLLISLLLIMFVILLFNFYKFKKERESLQELIEEKNKMEEFMLNLIPKPIFIMDITGRYLNVNKQFEDFFNVQREVIVGKDIKSVENRELEKLGKIIDMELKGARKYGLNAVSSKPLDISLRSQDFDVKRIKISKAFFVNDKGRIGGIVGIIEDITEQEKKISDLMKKAILDELTMVYNRRYFNLVVNEEIERAKRYQQKLSIIIFDVDFFKKINDTYGHQTGDYVLKKLSNIIKKSIRTTDMLFRIGGEEFAILLPNTDLEAALKVAEKLCRIVEGTRFDTVKKVTISMGVTELRQDDDMESFYKRGDKALYQAKENGRNRVESKH
ncbi:diguanylate cyclase [Deferribacter autotrophicus]|uniref:diguanylate cyclase n=1 Tax=Deferribacter autotrophicus TaxID=500465 RepID=A0A5A8F3E5_9BACT|nr:GGDEF domain-containing protein [Deferribacter autotrophicus]KAA0258036.1 diguanylate cyclase [Deferribacter autotrophicus]